MSILHDIKLAEGNIIVPMKNEQLKEMMIQFAETVLENYRRETQAKQDQKWYSTKDVAKIFGVSASTITRWKHCGYLTARTLGVEIFSL